jgi:hypothetical protein
MAAAVSGQVETLVTCNFMKHHAVAVVDPDVYLCSLYQEFPTEVLATMTRVAAGKRRSSLTSGDIVDALHRAGVLEFAARIRPDLT